MPNGLLGKKVVNARDTEVVYTVPAARTSTFNLNVLNNGESAATVNVYVSDKVYQTRDFEDYLTPLNYNKTWVAADTSNTLDLVGQSTSKMMTAMKTTPVEPAAANTASSPIAGKKIETLQTANGDGNFFLVSSPAAVGNQQLLLPQATVRPLLTTCFGPPTRTQTLRCLTYKVFPAAQAP